MAAPALPELASLILDNLPLGLWVADAKGELLYANAEFQEIMGMGARDDVAVGGYAEPYGICDRNGQPYPESRMPFVQAMQARTTVVVDDIVIHRRDGRRVNVRATARPQLDTSGAVQSVVIAFFDITREVEAERARAHSENQQRHTQRLEALGKLAGGIAHDFNNLLAGIKMLASHVRLGEQDPARLSSLRYIDDITDRGAELTRALLRFAQKESNHPRAVNFDEVIRDTVELAQRTIDRRIEVIADLGAPGATILGHRPQVEQVVMNLVVNARDAIPGAGRLILRTRSDGDQVVLEVEDTGTGIEPRVMERLFEPYVTTKDVGAVKGTGLGLAMVYGIVQSHDGTVEVAHTGPRGTIMRVRLPLAPPGTTVEAATVVPARVRGGAGTILFADDEPLMCEAARRGLRGLGYEVVTAEDGVRAVEIYQRERERISAVVLDVAMPNMGGVEAMEQLRLLDPTVRVLFTTGLSLGPDAAALAAGAHALLPKPYDLGALSEALERLLAPQ